MDKTISISLGGYSFIVDDHAYLKLKKYLDDIRLSLKGMEGTDDVIADIEIRIAELFKSRMTNREVVNESDIDYIIGIMGKPEQYIESDEIEADNSKKSQSFSSISNSTVKKKLYRDPDDKVLGGVLSGIAHYLGIESWITRVAWIVLFFADIPLTGTSFTIITYIIFWIILPKAETATQKYEMFGEAGNIESIKRNIEKTSEAGTNRDTLGDVLKIIGKLILVFFGFIFICVGLSLLFGAIFSMIATAGDIPVQIFGRFFDFQWQDTTAKAIIFVLLGVPGILLTYLGARMISNRVKINRIIVFSLIALWFAAMIGGGLLTASVFKSFSRSAEFTEKNAFTVDTDTITIGFDEFKQIGKKKMKFDFDFGDEALVKVNGKLIRKIDNNIEIRPSPTAQLFVNVVYSSKGSTLDNARKYAESINYNYSMTKNGELLLDDYIELPVNTKFRNQKAKVIVYIPNGKIIHSTNVKTLIFSDDNSDSKNYQKGINKFYKFVDQHYECLNCKTDNSESDNSKDETDSAKVNVSGKGINIQDGEGKVEINKNKIRILDGTDTINIGLSGN